jgi:hypothetical protein
LKSTLLRIAGNRSRQIRREWLPAYSKVSLRGGICHRQTETLPRRNKPPSNYAASVFVRTPT